MKIHEIAIKIGNFHVQKIKEEGILYDVEKIEQLIYAWEIFIKNAIVIASLGVISYIIKDSLSVFLLYFIFFLLRICFCGYHIINQTICMYFTIGVISYFGWIATKINTNIIFILIVYIICFVIALKIGVIDNPNKRLTSNKKRSLKRTGLIFLITIMFLNFILAIFSQSYLTNSIVLGVIIEFINLLYANFAYN